MPIKTTEDLMDFLGELQAQGMSLSGQDSAYQDTKYEVSIIPEVRGMVCVSWHEETCRQDGVVGPETICRFQRIGQIDPWDQEIDSLEKLHQAVCRLIDAAEYHEAHKHEREALGTYEA